MSTLASSECVQRHTSLYWQAQCLSQAAPKAVQRDRSSGKGLSFWPDSQARLLIDVADCPTVVQSWHKWEQPSGKILVDLLSSTPLKPSPAALGWRAAERPIRAALRALTHEALSNLLHRARKCTVQFPSEYLCAVSGLKETAVVAVEGWPGGMAGWLVSRLVIWLALVHCRALAKPLHPCG
ncbi:hypothetical protein PSTT_03548 [Puccinia striiformis]|uniref:Uncharacterized protein n=1 Tax=Puccinia striiformis TaxID=27350 RepID=A0A2S4VVY0_9BASI|nr:hypothetical protein PSTT_03548 [Puccinia striiformis]